MTLSIAPRHKVDCAVIAIMAFSILAYQVILTRLFSVMLYYHFAFIGISLAMLGMTLGAQKVFLKMGAYSWEQLQREWSKAALGFSISGAVLVLLILHIPFRPHYNDFLWLIPYLFLIMPFTYGGICITLLLTRSDTAVGQLYAADLVGASLGCLGIVGLLFYFDPVTIVFGLSTLTAYSAWLVNRQAGHPARLSKVLTVAWLIVTVLHGGVYLIDQRPFWISWAKGYKLESILFERWNVFSLVRVSEDNNHPFGWGFGHKPTAPGPNQLSLDIDAQAGTVITQFDGNDLSPFSYLDDDVINMGYHLRPVHDVAVVGVGGGRDILSALYMGAHHITGIELNPSIFEALTDKFGTFSGHLERLPQVTLMNAEARSWINQSSAKFDLIQISLIDTWAATAASGLTLSENKLYTVEAWKDFLDHLTPEGFLTVSRWFHPQIHKGEFYRLLSIATETLRQRGVADAEIRQHILAFSSPAQSMRDQSAVVTVAISPSAFTNEETAHARSEAEKHGFTVMVDLSTAWDSLSAELVSGKADQKFFDSLPLDLSASTDNRPFFFNMGRINPFQKDTMNRGTSDYNDQALNIIYALLLITMLGIVYFLTFPLWDSWKKLRGKWGIFFHLAYFAGIGVAFMLIEISQMQRLMVFLGHPVYGLSVILFTLLMFGGFGSATMGTYLRKENRPLWLAPLILCTVLVLTGLATPFLAQQLKPCSTLLRIFASITFLAPAGFFMGMMFPLGMRVSAPYREFQSWFWGINGATSVFGSVLGVVVSMETGIASAFWVGTIFYGLCALLIYKNSET